MFSSEVFGLMLVSTRSKRHKPEVNRKEEMADQSIFKNLLEEALGSITQELKLLAKASYIEERLKTLEETLEQKFEKRIKEQDARIEGLKSKIGHLEGKVVTFLNKTLSKLEINIDDGEQFSRRMCLRIDGIDLESDENDNSSSCMEKVQKVFEEMGVQVPAVSIDRAHRTGKRFPATDEKGRKIIGQDHQQMIVKFNNCGSRMMCYNNRKNLNNKRIKIDLTKSRLTFLNQARESYDWFRFRWCFLPSVENQIRLFLFFNTIGELSDIVTEIEEEVESVSE